MAFKDYRSRVRLADTLSVLIENKIPANITRAIHNLNTNNATNVKAGDRLTENILTSGGIGQGDSPSPFLFNLPMDKIIISESRYRMGNKKIGTAMLQQ